MKRLFTLTLALALLAILSGLGVARKSVESTPPRNVPSLPCCQCLGGTTAPLDLSTGQGGGPTDPIWSVAKVGQSTGPGPFIIPSGAYLTLPPANWIQPDAKPLPKLDADAGTWKYTVQFNIPRCVISSEVRLDGSFASDNGSVAVLDGKKVASCPGPNCFDLAGPRNPTSLTVSSILPGMHTLEIDVTNLVTNPKTPTGLLVRATLQGQCRTKATLP